MKRLAVWFLKLFNYKLVKIPSSSSELIPNVFSSQSDSMLAGLYRNKERGTAPKTIIDIGAAQGKWTQEAMQVQAMEHQVRQRSVCTIKQKNLLMRRSPRSIPS